MKKIILSATLLLASLTAAAQTMYVWQKGVGTAIDETLAGDMIFSSDGTAFTVLGRTFDTQTIDSITFDDAAVDAQTIAVTYGASGATAILPIGLAANESVAIDGAYVTATSTATEGKEVTYTLTGTSADGAFTQVGAYKCTVVLNNVSLTSLRGAAVDIQNGKRIDIKTPEGTANSLADFADGTQKACIYVKGHPEFSGAGTLSITGNTNHGLATKEYMRLKPSAGTISILAAKNDGIHAGQYIKMEGGALKVTGAAGDGIQVEPTKDATDEMNGQFIMQAGTIDITAASPDVKALRSDSLMTISGGTISITSTGDGSKGIAADADLLITEDDNPVSITVKCTGGTYPDPANPANTKKSHGISVGGNLTVKAGTLDISSTGKKGKSIKVDGISKKGNAATVKTNPVFNFDFTI